MGDVSDVVTSHIDWKRLRCDRNNSRYLMLTNVCFMVLNGLIPQREKGIQHDKTLDSSYLITDPLIAMIKYSV